jgi:hypothetical protein
MIPMRAKRILWVVVCLVSVLALTVALSAGGAGASTRATADQSWTDPAGDAQGGAPDLTAAQVTNDAAGTITMSVTVPMVAQTAMYVLLDTNMNSRIEYAIIAMGMGPGVVSPLAISLDTSGNTGVVSIPSLRMSSTASTVTLSFAKTDIGIDIGFGLKLATQTDAQLANNQFGDELPSGNMMYLYLLTTPPPPAPPAVVKPVIAAPVTTPTVAVAGKRLTVTFNVTRSDTGGPLTSGKMVCDPSVAGKVIPHAESFKAGTAKLSFLVPKTAKGKQLKVKLTINAGTQSATKVVTFRVK